MVKADVIEEKLNELEVFFKELTLNASNKDITSYGAGADYGLKVIKSMRKDLEKYKKDHQNKHLKQIYVGFSSVTRGVEGFNDLQIHERFENICEGIYEIRQDLNEHIKW